MARKRKNKIRVRIRKLGSERAWGLCWPGNLIELDDRCRPKFFLDSIVHEALHKIDENMNETRIKKGAKVISDLIWQLGFRRIYDENKPMKPYIRKSKKKNKNV